MTVIDRPSTGLARGAKGAGWALAALAILSLVGEAEAQSPTPRTLGLQQAVDMALDRNRTLRDARLALETAEDQVTEAWGNVYPDVSLNASYTRNVSVAKTFIPAIIFDPEADPDELVGVQFGAENMWQTELRVEQPLFRAAAFIGVSTAGRFRELQDEAVRGAQHRVVTNVRLAYYGVLLAQEELRLTENSIDRVRETLEETRAMNEAGLSSDYDVLRLEVELANLEPNLRRVRNSVAEAKRSLAVQLALENLDSVRVEGSLASMDLTRVAENTGENAEVLHFAGFAPEAAPSPDQAVGRAMERRSDVRQLDMTEDLRHAELRVEQSELLPEVSLFGSYQINAQENGSPDFFGETGEQRSYGRLVGVQVSLPIFQGFKRTARIGQKRAALQRAEEQTLLVRQQAENEVKTLLDQVEETRARAEAQQLAVSQARRGFDIASVQYREGLGSQLEVTDAELALRQSEFNYAQAVYDHLVARARLDRATGTVPMVDSEARWARRPAERDAVAGSSEPSSDS